MKVKGGEPTWMIGTPKLCLHRLMIMLDYQARQQQHRVCLTKPVMGKHCIEVTIGSEESFVSVLDRPK